MVLVNLFIDISPSPNMMSHEACPVIIANSKNWYRLYCVIQQSYHVNGIVVGGDEIWEILSLEQESIPTSLAFWASVLTITACRVPDGTTQTTPTCLRGCSHEMSVQTTHYSDVISRIATSRWFRFILHLTNSGHRSMPGKGNGSYLDYKVLLRRSSLFEKKGRHSFQNNNILCADLNHGSAPVHPLLHTISALPLHRHTYTPHPSQPTENPHQHWQTQKCSHTITASNKVTETISHKTTNYHLKDIPKWNWWGDSKIIL